MIFKILSFSIFFTPFYGFGQKLYSEANFLSFADPEQGAYLEAIISVDAGSMFSSRQVDSFFLRKAEIGLLIKKFESNETVFADKYVLSSPLTKDSIFPYNLLDIQRISLKNGKYNLQLFVVDILGSKDTLKTSQQLNVNFKKSETFLSDILFAESIKPATSTSKLSKSGFDIVPFTGNFFPKGFNSLKFYFEVVFGESVLAISDRNIVANFFIQNSDTKQAVAGFGAFSRDEIKKVNVFYREFDISNLPSGNYELVIEIKNRKNETLAAKSSFFQRSNPEVLPNLTNDSSSISELDYAKVNLNQTFADTFTNVNLLADCIKSLYPISTNSEKTFQRNQLNFGNLDLMKKYLLAFWQSRNPLTPELAWDEYFRKVKIVIKNFSTQIQRGYETDRGRVLLQYGEPNTMDIHRFEPSSFPYEIWHYYQISNSKVNRQQSNKRFVFYTNDRSTNDYLLLHSTAIGETFDERWQMKLNSRSDQSRNFDDNQPLDEQGSGINNRYGSRSNDQFKTPY